MCLSLVLEKVEKTQSGRATSSSGANCGLDSEQGDGKKAEKLILSIDAPSEIENSRLWVAEAERRLKELREATVEEIRVEEVFRRARAAIT
ncbi:MAG: hypothetical protein C4B58_14675 [Deltaproteobacteria bacterium]|nr:MAG: hypothetical protein C4B58_14675 [Deltaproteobacteria bacterium]